MSIKILSVDDEPDLEMLIRQKFRKQIREGEYVFIFAQNGLEALSALVQNPDTDMVLTDINMPEMDGLTLLVRINELKNPSLKTVIVSAYGDMENIRVAMNRGAFDFVTKPIDFEDLEVTIRKAIEQISIMKNAMKEHDQLVAIRYDLNIAREIQQSILPKKFPPFPERNDFDLYAHMNAAKSVGGDFYDFFLIDSERVGLVIADVSDKGVPAAIFMAVSRTIIRATAIKGMPSAECLDYANNLLTKENATEMFVTVFYGIFNTRTGELSFSSAGHNPPYIIGNDGTVTALEMTGDIVLGVFEGISYKTKSVTLKPGSALYLYTDGVTEAMNVPKELYGEPRLENLLKGLSKSSVKDIVNTVISDLEVFTEGAPQSDDITMLALRYNG